MTVRPRTEPVFYVKVAPEGEGAERVDLSHKVLSFVFEDSEKKADKLLLTVDNWDLKNFDDPVWRKGNILEVSWGYPGDMAPARSDLRRGVVLVTVDLRRASRDHLPRHQRSRINGRVTHRDGKPVVRSAGDVGHVRWLAWTRDAVGIRQACALRRVHLASVPGVKRRRGDREPKQPGAR